MTSTKEKGAIPFENAPHGTTAPNQSNTVSPQREGQRPEYHPLSWRGTAAVQTGDQAKTTTEKAPDPVAEWHSLADQARKAQKPFRGRSKRRARAEAIRRKRGGA